jgi:hypothetical protein
MATQMSAGNFIQKKWTEAQHYACQPVDVRVNFPENSPLHFLQRYAKAEPLPTLISVENKT